VAEFLKRIAARLPNSWQMEIKRHRFRRQILNGHFGATIPEFHLLATLIERGAWVVDVGANVGHYTKRFSDLVGPFGRVIALEPVPHTFSLLAANVILFRNRNVTLLNIAASIRQSELSMDVPRSVSGIRNYYRAHVVAASGELRLLACPLDALQFDARIYLIKVDAEGHDEMVLRGAEDLLRRDRPALLVEASDDRVVEFLADLGYRGTSVPGSPNTLFRWEPSDGTLERA
jgi:FkbM family methyltransferase